MSELLASVYNLQSARTKKRSVNILDGNPESDSGAADILKAVIPRTTVGTD